jgi:hypothetical protein
VNTNDAKTDGMIFPSDKTRVSANDQTTGYLDGKLVAGTNIALTQNNDGGNETLSISAIVPTSADEKVKVSSNDTTVGYLDGKLVAGTNITLTQNNDGGNETLTIATTVVNTDETAKVSSNDTTAGYLNGKLVAGTNVTFTEGNDGGNETLTISAAGGVTGFTASQNTASPNNTVNASRLLVNATSTDADAVIQPKGAGALLARLPDGTATGGNKRGVRAIDLSLYAVGAASVASGFSSVVIGNDNTASGVYSCVVSADSQNSANGNRSAVVVSGSSTASGLYANVIGGYLSVSNGQFSNAIGGERLYASGDYSFAAGYNTVADRYGMRAYAAGAFQVAGDCQREQYILRKSTTNATQTELTANGSAAAAATRIAIASDATYTFHGLVTARRTDADNESACWEIKGGIDNNAGTTALVGSVMITILGDDSSGTWGLSVEADNTNDALIIKVTGEAAKTIRWGATVTLMKVAG